MGTNGASGNTWTVTCVRCDYKATWFTGPQKDAA